MKKFDFKKNKKLITWIVILAIVAAIGWFIYRQNMKSKAIKYFEANTQWLINTGAGKGNSWANNIENDRQTEGNALYGLSFEEAVRRSVDYGARSKYGYSPLSGKFEGA